MRLPFADPFVGNKEPIPIYPVADGVPRLRVRTGGSEKVTDNKVDRLSEIEKCASRVPVDGVRQGPIFDRHKWTQATQKVNGSTQAANFSAFDIYFDEMKRSNPAEKIVEANYVDLNRLWVCDVRNVVYSLPQPTF